MPLKGDAKIRYQRDYMRRRRAGGVRPPLDPAASGPSDAKPPPASFEPAGAHPELTVLQARLEELEAELTEWRKKAQGWRALETQFEFTKHGAPFSQAEFKKILACLHPDNVAGTGRENKFTEAFGLFSAREALLARPAPRPVAPGLPRTTAEWVARKVAVDAERKRKRAAAKEARKPKKRLSC
jgi:hypothetical protein